MSKAFTKDDPPADLDPDPADEPLARGPRHITPEGFQKLQHELGNLLRVERPKVTAEVSAAAAQGDRSENAEYIYGKKKLREIDRRLRYLSRLLERLTVVPPNGAKEVVRFGCRVTVVDEEGREATWRLVGPDELDIRSKAISVESPFAKALLGHKVGDAVTVQRPLGPIELELIRIDPSNHPSSGGNPP